MARDEATFAEKMEAARQKHDDFWKKWDADPKNRYEFANPDARDFANSTLRFDVEYEESLKNEARKVAERDALGEPYWKDDPEKLGYRYMYYPKLAEEQRRNSETHGITVLASTGHTSRYSGFSGRIENLFEKILEKLFADDSFFKKFQNFLERAMEKPLEIDTRLIRPTTVTVTSLEPGPSALSREQVAQLTGASPENIHFVSSTENPMADLSSPRRIQPQQKQKDNTPIL